MTRAYVEQERKAALWLGHHFWNREAEKWRAVADDKTRDVQDRQAAIKRMEKAWWAMRLCKAKGRWCRADSEEQTPPPSAPLQKARAPENFVLESEVLKQH